MVQFLSIFFSWISSIFVGFFKSSRFFCVTLYIRITVQRLKTKELLHYLSTQVQLVLTDIASHKIFRLNIIKPSLVNTS